MKKIFISILTSSFIFFGITFSEEIKGKEGVVGFDYIETTNELVFTEIDVNNKFYVYLNPMLKGIDKDLILYVGEEGKNVFMVANGKKEAEYKDISLVKIPENIQDGSIYSYVGKNEDGSFDYLLNGEIKVSGFHSIETNFLSPDGESFAFFGTNSFGEKVLVIDSEEFKVYNFYKLFGNNIQNILSAGYNKRGDEFAYIVKNTDTNEGYTIKTFKKEGNTWFENDLGLGKKSHDLIYTSNSYLNYYPFDGDIVSRNQFVILIKSENKYKGIFNTGNRIPRGGLDYYNVSKKGNIEAKYLFHNYNITYSNDLKKYALIDLETGDFFMNGKFIKKLQIPIDENPVDGGRGNYIYPNVVFSKDSESYFYIEYQGGKTYKIVKDGIPGDLYDDIYNAKYIGDTHEILFIGSQNGKKYLRKI